MKKIYLLIILSVIIFSGCGKEEKKSDAYGNFESVETVVSAESSGKLLDFTVEEGQIIELGETVGVIDTSQLYLKKLQLIQQKNLVRTKFRNTASQVSVYQEQKKVAVRERERIERLIKDNAATGKQLDDINGNIDVLNKQIAAVEVQNTTTNEELRNLDVQISQINDQLQKGLVINPSKGTVTLKLAEEGEVVNFGKPLYKIADLSVLELKVYVSATQLPQITIGQKVKVMIDDGKDAYKTFKGVIVWISSKAEFTPKIVQTKEERVNLVYAVKVSVENKEGILKIGMPGEVVF